MQPDFDNKIVPTLNHVVGQTRAVNVLRTALDAFFNERLGGGDVKAFQHTLMCGPSGVGKTLLSEILADELCCNLHTELARIRSASTPLSSVTCSFSVKARGRFV